jgi:hypothetical protein
MRSQTVITLKSSPHHNRLQLPNWLTGTCSTCIATWQPEHQEACKQATWALTRQSLEAQPCIAFTTMYSETPRCLSYISILVVVSAAVISRKPVALVYCQCSSAAVTQPNTSQYAMQDGLGQLMLKGLASAVRGTVPLEADPQPVGAWQTLLLHHHVQRSGGYAPEHCERTDLCSIVRPALRVARTLVNNPESTA